MSGKRLSLLFLRCSWVPHRARFFAVHLLFVAGEWRRACAARFARLCDRFVLQFVARRLALCLFGAIVLQLPAILQASSLVGGEAFEIDAPADENATQRIRPILETLQADLQNVRVMRIKNVLLVRVEDRRYCAGKYCLTYVLNEQTGGILTSALLPRSFAIFPFFARRSFLAGTETLIFGDVGEKIKVHLLLGAGFAAFLSVPG